MFGKKKDGGAAPEKAAPAKAAAKPKKASKKKKVAITKAGPGFFALHVEKFVIALVAAGVGYFIYAGMAEEGFPESKAPTNLQTSSDNLLRQIKEDHWEAMQADEETKTERDVVPTVYTAKTLSVRAPVPYERWDQGEVVWDPVIGTVYEKRGDPTVLPPEYLLATNVFGPVAIEVPKEVPDPWEELEDAEPIKPKGSSSRRRGRGGAGAGGGMGGGYGGEAGGMGAGYGGEGGGEGGGMYGGMGGGAEGAKKVRRLKASYDLGVQLGSATGGGGMGMGMGMGGEAGGDGMYGGMGGGMGMGMGMGMGSGAGAGGTNTSGGLGEKKEDRGPKTRVASRGTMFNAITAVVPHKKMADEYKELFENSGSFIASRDMPVYLTFEVQRADVSKDPTRELTDADWKDITNGGKQYNLGKRNKWAIKGPVGRKVPEVIDRNSVDSGLTMPIPPMLVRDYRKFSKHPLVDWSWDSKRLVNPDAEEPEEPEEDDDPADDDNFLPGASRRNTGGGGMGMGMGMGGGMGMGMGGGMGYGGEGGDGGGMYGGMGGEGMYGGGGEGGYGGEGGDGGSMYGGMGGEGMYGGGGGGMGGPSLTAVQPEYKMIRCYDLLPVSADVVGKVFRYRIRLVMRDPNYPEDDSIPAVDPADMKEEVWARVAKLVEQDKPKSKEKDKANGNKPVRTLLKTEWSEPSAPVRVQAPFEVFAGNIDFDGSRVFANKYSVSAKEAQAEVVVTAMHGPTGTSFATEQTVRRGSVLNDKTDIEFIDPVSKVIKVKENHEMVSGATIVDMLGGSPLVGYGKDDPQRSNGEMMILHRDGRLQFTSDIDDLFLYRMYSYQDEKEAAAKASKTQQESNAGAGGGYGGGYGGG